MKYQDRLSDIGLRAILLLILFSLPFFINAQQSMRVNLQIVTPNDQTVLVDGNLTNYSPAYSNSVDMDDAWKMSNSGENLGILRNNQVLVVERRKVIETTDTTFFKMWNMHPYNYQLQIITKHFDQPRLMARLKDNYLNTFTDVALNDTTNIPFKVDGTPGSYNPMRFALIYSTANPVYLPVSFINLKTYRKNNAIQVEWNVINEVSVDKYIIEHSLDGRYFQQVGSIPASNAGFKSYRFTDADAVTGDNFYRLRAVRLTGNVEYSEISKVSAIDIAMGVYPNPSIKRSFHLQIGSGAPGLYTLSLINASGTVYPLKPLNISAGQTVQVIELPANALPGIYRLKVTAPGNHQQVISVYLL